MRNFFLEESFTDVLTPPLVENPGMEVHIHPFKVTSVNSSSNVKGYLQTSPEFAMKKILTFCHELNLIFTISYSFRDEPISEIHRPSFLMCEWYRKNEFYTQIMDDCESLIKYCHGYLKNKSVPTKELNYKFQRVTVQDLFLETLNLDILNFLDKDDLKKKIKLDHRDVPLPEQDLSWDDYYFLLFLNKVEPTLLEIPYILLYNFPHHLKALSTINNNDSRVCDRFEIYMNGIEICNCFNELTNFEEQKKRFQIDALEKKKLYGYELPEPAEFYTTLKSGLPPSSGVAMGVERLLLALTGEREVFFS